MRSCLGLLDAHRRLRARNLHATRCRGQSKDTKGKGTKEKSPAPKGGKGTGVKNLAAQKRIFPYEDGTFSIGSVHVDWPGICKLNGWDPTKLCGPVTMAMGTSREANCCWGHAAGCAAHIVPKLKNGKAFVASEHKADYTAKGLTTVREVLKAEAKTGKPPPGEPRMTRGGVAVYPARHFGPPA